MKKILIPVTLIFLTILLSGWGSKGHKKISQSSALCLPATISFLDPAWTNVVTSRASDADYRKDQDPEESRRHYIDIDNYPEFVANGFISSSYDSAVFNHGFSFVMDQGILPWATLRTYDSLKSCFQRGDWNRSALFAADLGHYVADGHMPFHITRNYNGQFTGQTDIHSRYESSMIKKYESLLLYPADSAVMIQNVSSYIFSYLYHNYKYVDSVLLADTYAKQTAGNVSSDVYYFTLWTKSGAFTNGLMQHGSHALASLIYTAWVEAGSPRMYPNAIREEENFAPVSLRPVYPNPAGNVTYFPVEINDHTSSYTIEIYDQEGHLRDTILKKTASGGTQIVSWDAGGVESGIYFCLLKSGNHRSIRKFIIRH